MDIEKKSSLIVEIAPERNAWDPKEQKPQPPPEIKRAFPKNHMQADQTGYGREKPTEIGSKNRYQSSCEIIFLGKENKYCRKYQQKPNYHSLSWLG